MRWKYLSVFLLLIGFSKKTISQGNTFQNNYVVAGYAVGDNRVALPYKVDGEYEGNPYFSKDWAKGSVKTTDNQEFSNRLLFMYDKIAGNLYFKNQDSATIMEADKSKISSFTLITDKPHVFMQGGSFSTDFAGKFIEVLVLDDKGYSLFKYITTSFEDPATSKAAQAMTQSISSGRYVDKVTYFIYYDKVLQPVDFKKKSFVKSLKADDAAKVEAYLKDNDGNFNESYVINMLGDINEPAR